MLSIISNVHLMHSKSLPFSMAVRVENRTIKNVVEYLPALTRCGKTFFVSRYLLRHCAKRNQAGRQRTNGLIP